MKDINNEQNNVPTIAPKAFNKINEPDALTIYLVFKWSIMWAKLNEYIGKDNPPIKKNIIITI